MGCLDRISDPFTKLFYETQVQKYQLKYCFIFFNSVILQFEWNLFEYLQHYYLFYFHLVFEWWCSKNYKIKSFKGMKFVLLKNPEFWLAYKYFNTIKYSEKY